MAALSIRGLAKSFAAVGDAPEKPVIAQLDLTVRSGERVAIIGPSGCGKSTLLNMIAGLESADAGRIEKPADWRMAFVFQEPRLLGWRTVQENLALVLDDPGNVAEVDRWLDAVGLRDARDVFASRLSLGMARRASIARAFIVNPQLLLMDEPFVSLDAPTSLRLQSLMTQLLERERTALLFVTHELREAIRLCDRLVFLSPAPSSILFECDIQLSPAERQIERTVEAFREDLVRRQNIDIGRLVVDSEGNDGN